MAVLNPIVFPFPQPAIVKGLVIAAESILILELEVSK